MDTPQQEQLQAEVDSLSESLKNCLVAASDRHDQLEKDLKSFRDYEQLLGEINQFIVSYSMMNEETATNIPALRTLIANLEARAAFFQVKYGIIFISIVFKRFIISSLSKLQTLFLFIPNYHL